MSYKKNPKEITAILDGGKRMGQILDTLSTMVAPGVSADALDREAERLIRAAGGEPAFKGYRSRRGDTPFPATICFSRNEELVHGIPHADKIIREGDIVTLDIGMRWPANDPSGGYFTDTALTIPVGEIPEKVQKLLDVTREALEVGIRAATPGASVARIGRDIQLYVESQGRYGIVRDLVGHGVGHAVHEDPRVPNYYDKSLESWILEPGVVIAIEPMITLGSHEVELGPDDWTIFSKDRSWSAHFEHTIVITENGPVVATRRPREL